MRIKVEEGSSERRLVAAVSQDSTAYRYKNVYNHIIYVDMVWAQESTQSLERSVEDGWTPVYEGDSITIQF